MVTKQKFDLKQLQSLSTEDTCILKLHFLRPKTLKCVKVGSSVHKKFLLDSISEKKNPELFKLCHNLKRQTFRSKARKMADMAAQYDASGHAIKANGNKKANDSLPAKVAIADFIDATLSPTKLGQQYDAKRPKAMLPHTVAEFKDWDYSFRNASGQVVPQEVRYTIHKFIVDPSYCDGEDMNFIWNETNTMMTIAYKYSDALNYPLTGLQLFTRNGQLVFSQDSAMAKSLEETQAPRRNPEDGNVWDHFAIGYDEPQEAATVSHGDGLKGFDLRLVPQKQRDGITIQQNFLLVCTRNKRPVIETGAVQAGFTHVTTALNNSWMPGQHTGGVPAAGTTSQFNFGNSWQPNTGAPSSNSFGGGGQSSGTLNFGSLSFNPFPNQPGNTNPFQPQQQTSNTNPFQPQQQISTMFPPSSFAPVVTFGAPAAPPTPAPAPASPFQPVAQVPATAATQTPAPVLKVLFEEPIIGAL